MIRYSEQSLGPGSTLHTANSRQAPGANQPKRGSQTMDQLELHHLDLLQTSAAVAGTLLVSADGATTTSAPAPLKHPASLLLSSRSSRQARTRRKRWQSGTCQAWCSASV